MVELWPTAYGRLRESGELDSQRFISPMDSNYLWFESLDWLDRPGPKIELKDRTHLMPFGINGVGDWWAWQVIGTTPDRFPIVLLPHDRNAFQYFAPNFSAALFRLILEFLCDDVFLLPDEDDDGKFSLAEVQSVVHSWTRKLNEFFEPEWVSILGSIADDELKEYVHSSYYKYPCLLLPDEADSIIREQLAFAKLDQQIPFRRPELDLQ